MKNLSSTSQGECVAVPFGRSKRLSSSGHTSAGDAACKALKSFHGSTKAGDRRSLSPCLQLAEMESCRMPRCALSVVTSGRTDVDYVRKELEES